MGGPSRGIKLATVLWALLIGGGIIVLAGSVLLPSTKRARIDWDEIERREAAEAAAAAAATQATTNPADAMPPATAPADE